MKQFLIAIVFIASCAAATGQTATISEDQAADAERAAISAERSRSEAAYLQEQKACYQKFAVNDCLRDAGGRHRKLAADLRHREIALNDAQRKRQAAEQARSRQEKAEAERQKQAGQQSGDQQTKAAQDLQKRQERAASGSNDRAKGAAGESKNVQDAKAREQRHLDETASQARKAASAATQRAEYDEKIKAAAERKADLERRRKENPKPPANPLPMPP